MVLTLLLASGWLKLLLCSLLFTFPRTRTVRMRQWKRENCLPTSSEANVYIDKIIVNNSMWQKYVSCILHTIICFLCTKIRNWINKCLEFAKMISKPSLPSTHIKCSQKFLQPTITGIDSSIICTDILWSVGDSMRDSFMGWCNPLH